MGVKAAESTIEGKSVYAYDKKSKPAIAYEEFTKGGAEEWRKR